MSDKPIGATGVITATNTTPTAAASSQSAVEIDCVGLSAVGVQVTGSYSAVGGLSGQVTVDGLTWVTLGAAGTFTRQTTGVATATIASAVQDVFKVTVRGAKKFRVTALGTVTGTAAISIQGADMGAGETAAAGGGTVDTVVAGAGITVNSTDPANPIVASTGAGPAAVLLGAGPTNITNSAHSNRAVRSDESAGASVVFAATPTSGALEGDLVTILNTDIGIITATGTIQGSPDFRQFVVKGESLIAQYDDVADVYWSQTPDIRKGGREPSFMVVGQNASATISATGIITQSAFDGSTATARTAAATNRFTHHHRVSFIQAAQAINRHAGSNLSTASSRMAFVPTAAIRYGWKVRIVAGIGDALTAGNFEMGIGPTPAIGSEPSARINCIALAGDGTDAQLFLMHNDASGVCTEVALNGGTGFPNNTNSADMYEAVFTCYSDGTTRFFFYYFRNLTSDVEVRGQITSADVPVAGTAIGAYAIRGSAADAALVSATLELGGFYGGQFA